MPAKKTPDTPTADWAKKIFRLPPDMERPLAQRLFDTGEKFQAVMVTLLRGWLAGEIDVAALRAKLAAREGK